MASMMALAASLDTNVLPKELPIKGMREVCEFEHVNLVSEHGGKACL